MNKFTETQDTLRKEYERVYQTIMSSYREARALAL